VTQLWSDTCKKILKILKKIQKNQKLTRGIDFNAVWSN